MNTNTSGLWVLSRKTMKQIGKIYSFFIRVTIAGLPTAKRSNNNVNKKIGILVSIFQIKAVFRKYQMRSCVIETSVSFAPKKVKKKIHFPSSIERKCSIRVTGYIIPAVNSIWNVRFHFHCDLEIRKTNSEIYIFNICAESAQRMKSPVLKYFASIRHTPYAFELWICIHERFTKNRIKFNHHPFGKSINKFN